ncbi:alpha/beta hydrolase [Patescibacteria group bacterium]|nr:alpha/beta hydrolase [Patescibacteria group bacterium]
MVISQGFKEKKILIQGLEVNYKIQGVESPLLILHGWGNSSDAWVSIQKILAEEGFKVIVPDLPGFGKSKTPKKYWNIDDYVWWLQSFIEKTKIRKPFFLLGHSFGGRIAIKFSVKYPEKIKSQILLDSAGIKSNLNFKQKTIFLLVKIGNYLFPKKSLVEFGNIARNIFYKIIREKDYVKLNETMKGTIKKILNEDLLDFLPNIKIKTLLVWGKRDKMIPIKYAYLMKEKIPNSKLIILPDSGHSPQRDNPKKLAQIIIRFLRP